MSGFAAANSTTSLQEPRCRLPLVGAVGNEIVLASPVISNAALEQSSVGVNAQLLPGKRSAKLGPRSR